MGMNSDPSHVIQYEIVVYDKHIYDNRLTLKYFRCFLSLIFMTFPLTISINYPFAMSGGFPFQTFLLSSQI